MLGLEVGAIMTCALYMLGKHFTNRATFQLPTYAYFDSPGTFFVDQASLESVSAAWVLGLN